MSRGNTETAPVIRVSGLTTRLAGRTIHDNLDLEVRRGEILGVVGGSGTGKSVLLKTIVGLIPAAAGEITIFGENLARMDPGHRRGFEQRIGVLFQDGALFSSLTVGQNIEVPLREHLRLPRALMDEIAALKIGLVGLDPEVGTRMPAELSGGMRKRAALARALALDPEIIFLDEPTAGLDPIGAAELDELISGLREALGLTVFLVTHDLDTLNTICDRIAVLADRRVLAIGTMDDMMREAHPWIRSYFHGPRGRAATAGAARRSGG